LDHTTFEVIGADSPDTGTLRGRASQRPKSPAGTGSVREPTDSSFVTMYIDDDCMGAGGSMTITLLGPSMRLANEAIAKRILAKVRDHSPAPGLLTLDRWELAEREIRLALDAAGRAILKR
jgi:hypothetical protein